MSIKHKDIELLWVATITGIMVEAGCNEPTEQSIARVQINPESWEGGVNPEID